MDCLISGTGLERIPVFCLLLLIVLVTSLVFALLWLCSCVCASQLNSSRAWIRVLVCGSSMAFNGIPGTTLSGNIQEQPEGQQRDSLHIAPSLWCERTAVCTPAWPYQLASRPKKQALPHFMPR